MSALQLNGATSGSVTLTPPAVAGTNTLTLPAKTGNIITSADTGTVTQTMLSTNVAGNGPAFIVYQSSVQNLTSSTFIVVQYQTKENDTLTAFNNTASTATLNGLSVPAYAFMPNIAGYYQISGAVYVNVAVSASSAIIGSIGKNGSEYKRGTALNYAGNGICSALVYLNGTTDYVQFYVYQTYGTPQTTAGQSLTWFGGSLVRSA